MNVYCTLFDSNYLDKGLVLYRSLEKHEKSFRLYVFAFDQRCLEILRKESLEHMVVISLEEFETNELLQVKKSRTRAEYCWTCTPWTIRYVLDNYHEACCTYIDADMMFFSSPQYIFDAMRARACSVLITPHRFPNTTAWRRREKLVGTYCVEFNTFFNDDNGNAALNWWAEQCLDWCFYTADPEESRYGDQKYLNEFEKRFSGIYVCDEWGAGIAPWNAGQLALSALDDAEDVPHIMVKASGQRYPIVFCHYASIMHLSETLINVGSGVSNRPLHRLLYDSYVEEIRRERKLLLTRYGLKLYVRRKVTGNLLRAFYQRFLAPIYHLRRLSDIYRI